MKGYVEASGFPLAEVAGRRIPRIILGAHPYDATTYTSKERDQQYLMRWTGPRSMVELMKPVVERFRVTASRGFPSDSNLSRWHREALEITMDELDTEIAIALGSTLPTKGRVDNWKYVYRLSLKAAGNEFKEKWATDPIYQYWHDKRKQTQSDIDDFIRKASNLSLEAPEELRKVEVDYEKLEQMIDSYQGFRIPLYVSNEGWEFMVLARRFDELQEAANLVKRKLGTFLLGTHNAGIVIPMAEEARLRVDGYLTPVNKAGILMFPTQKLVEQAIRACGKPIVGIKPLGGGRVNPKEAFEYVFQEIGVPTTMVGIGSIEEAQETLGAAKTTLMT